MRSHDLADNDDVSICGYRRGTIELSELLDSNIYLMNGF